MEPDTLSRFESPAVQNYLDMLQGIISRMANNSANCKTWLLGIITASLALMFDKEINYDFIWVLVVLSTIFYCLDSFYLGIERNFKQVQKNFVEGVRGNDYEDLLYYMPHTSFKDRIYSTLNALWSFSTTPIYLPIIIAFLLLKFFG